MPTRIKPSIDLRPCTLDKESITRIVRLIEREFDYSQFSASQNIWEVYAEHGASFLEIISERDTLDSFIGEGTGTEKGDVRHITVTFNAVEASVKLTAKPEASLWFEHFLFDLKKAILPPSFSQLASYVRGNWSISVSIPVVVSDFIVESSVPYSRIVITKRPPNPFIENVKAGIAANFIWLVLTFLFGVGSTLFISWIRNRP